MAGASMTAEELLNRAGIHFDRYTIGNYTSTCPRCSATRKPHHQKLRCLGVKIDDRGVTWHCNHCEWSGPEKGTGQGNSHDRNPVAIYDYTREDGTLLFQKVRNPPGSKIRFYCRRPDGSGGWINNLNGINHKPLYRWPEVLEAMAQDLEIAIAEGEKDCDQLWSVGIPATCNFDGAADITKGSNVKPKWKLEYSQQLAGACLIVFNDHDAPGYAHAEAVCRMSSGTAKRLRKLELAKHWPEIQEGGDISDWLAAGHTREELDALIGQAPDYASQEPPHSLNDGAAFGYSWHLIWHGEVDPISERKWLVEGLLPETGVALISGQWGTYTVGFLLYHGGLDKGAI
jgi:hypothetical protein